MMKKRVPSFKCRYNELQNPKLCRFEKHSDTFTHNYITTIFSQFLLDLFISRSNQYSSLLNSLLGEMDTLIIYDFFYTFDDF